MLGGCGAGGGGLAEACSPLMVPDRFQNGPSRRFGQAPDPPGSPMNPYAKPSDGLEPSTPSLPSKQADEAATPGM